MRQGEREQAGLKKELGRVGRRRGWASWHACVLVHDGCGEDETDRAGPRRRGTGARTKATDADEAGPQRRESGGRVDEGNNTDKPAPSGRGREGAWVCDRGLALTGGVHLSADAGARGLAGLDWAAWAEISFSIFLNL
jgi:hypothetical protein